MRISPETGPSADPRAQAQRRVVAGLCLGGGNWVLYWTVTTAWTEVFFFGLWLGYILTVDGLTLRCTGTSLLNRGAGRFVLAFLVSVPFWWMFELCNWRLHNWSYVHPVLQGQAIHVLLFSLCFSTVLPALFETAELLGSTRLFGRDWHGPRLPHNSTLSWLVVALGVASLVSMLLFPRQFFPLVWIFPLMIFDPINSRMGWPSLWEQAARGSWRLPLVLAATGLVCGFFWEFWNYWNVGVRWEYHLPVFLSYPHVFQMPLPGYLGYLPFAASAYAFYQTAGNLLTHGLSDPLSLFQHPGQYQNRRLHGLLTITTRLRTAAISARPLRRQFPAGSRQAAGSQDQPHRSLTGPQEAIMRAAAYRRMGINSPLVRQGFEMCRQATRQTGEIEYAVTQLLPPELRIALWSLYGAARTIDELAETGTDGAPGLERWIHSFDEDLRRHGSNDPIRAALLHTVLSWNLPPAYLKTVFQGQLADAAGREFTTWQEWYDYVDLVNVPFVIQAASLFVQNAGLSVSLHHDNGAWDVWQNLARAINLTDAIADLSEDSAHATVRLPAELLDAFGIRREELLAGQRPPALGTLVRHATATARRWFDNSPELPPILHPALGLALRSYLSLHRLLLDTIDEHADSLPPYPITIRPRDARRLLRPARAQAALARALFPSPLGDTPHRPLTVLSPSASTPRPGSRTAAQIPQTTRSALQPGTTSLPRHIAIIMDGNGRWAAGQGLPRTDGHHAGARTLEEVIDAALEIGLSHLTVYAFSTENWKRPADEVNTLMHLLPRDLLHKNTSNWRDQGVRVLWAGQRAGLPLDMVSILTSMVEHTRHNTRLTLTLCVNYGGRAEITTAAARLAADAIAGRIEPHTLSEPQFATYLHIPDLPDVDILLRTGAEKRLSNFLPWQTTYSEIIFTDKPWPQFNRHDLWDIIQTYTQRNRRYGEASPSGHTLH
ncbi:di-trans,poly-cis-decaprenylcistransferase [Streptomyces sp. ET3-23]|uniref:polyprenyl diphosphate synthase n=1 Tax=Streptomyces sp. ET3-23 TaxID=2885643 RepID=UPI001D0FD6AD|nr:polyprenyl diphosphate synthase [Streptomyces sp. ET3-23]MCC2275208.1 di-trans,poly-cis-decaprenylcistransferase [Streptomyces sp. ET3-23]